MRSDLDALLAEAAEAVDDPELARRLGEMRGAAHDMATALVLGHGLSWESASELVEGHPAFSTASKVAVEIVTAVR